MVHEIIKTFEFERLIEEKIKNNCKELIVVKGCGIDNLALNNVQTLFVIDRESINNDSCDLNEVIAKAAPKLATGEKFALLYEDFILASELLVSFLTVYGYEITIIDNNLFQEYYPLPKWVDFEGLKHKIDNYKNSKLTDIYEDYICDDSDILVSYQNFKDFAKAKWLPLFNVNSDYLPVESCEKNVEVFSLGSTSSTYSIGLLSILKSEKKNILIKSEDNPLAQAQNALILILNKFGYNLSKVDTRLPNNKKTDFDVYEKILKRKNESYSFKNINFYTNPGYSLETVAISQGEIIDSIVKNAQLASEGSNEYNDIFVTAPTGSGKSVLFQIPAIYLAESEKELLTIVISPLIGLMNDQVDNIQSLTDKAATINSDYTPEEKEEIKEKIQKKEVSILYISPETLLSNNPITTLIGEERQIGLLVIDESHIVSTWGKSFRPDYWFLGDYISKLRTKDGRKFPIATFSATITYGGDDDMHADIIDSLHMKTGKYEYIAPMRRDDISFDIRLLDKVNDYQKEKDDTAKSTLVSLLEENKKTIAYFPYTKTVNTFSHELPNKGVGRYHGALNALEKTNTADEFKNGKIKLMLATKAFGMGIDINDVEVVYHYAPTGNLCDYVQEIGRAARRPDINGLAMVDFYKDNDYKYINQLFGMSSIKNYQIVETLRKIAKIYFEKQRRNFTVSPDDFAYIFPTLMPDQIDTSFKTTLLMIQKDFERMSNLIFKPLVFKPRSLFTRAYVMVKEEDKVKFKRNKFNSYFKLYATGDEMATKFTENKSYYRRDYDSGEIVKAESAIKTQVKFQGDVYTVDLKGLWEDNFSKLSFNQFKYEFYTGTLSGLEIGKNLLPEYILSVRSKVGNFSQMFSYFKAIMNEFDDILGKPEYVDKQFSAKDLAKEIENRKDVMGLDHYEAIVAAESFIRITNNYKSKKQLIPSSIFKFNSATGKYSMSSLSKLRSVISDMIKNCETQYRQTFLTDARNFLVGNKNNEANTDPKCLIAQLLEVFNLGTYDVLSGDRPEYFIRVNSITSIEKIINNSNYQSEMVKMVKKRHDDSKKRMSNFFVNLKTDKERWDYIEKYFAGMQDEYDEPETVEDLI